MAVSEPSIAFAWIYTLLSGDAQLTSLAPGGIWRSMAPDKTAMPFVTFNWQSGQDITSMNEFRLMVNGLLQIRATGEAANTDAVIQAAARIDALLGDPPASGTVTGGLILASWRESAVSLDELLPSGVLLHHEGGLYRMQLQKTS